ncbi:MAG: HNH endonuclease [Burkholderiales bacterium]|nr:HNH endonuclease [Burkholderiales bacterium]
MKFWAGVTDNDWYAFLAQRRPDEVNFWQPSGRAPFTSLPPGTPFLFKLKRPHNHIAGGGAFVRFVTVPFALCWDAFGERNGAPTRAGLEGLLRPLVPEWQGDRTPIGCTILSNPFFLPRDAWIEAPPAWKSNIVQGKTFDTATADGAGLWQDVADRLAARALIETDAKSLVMPTAYGAEFLTRARLGQGAFRILVTEAYRRRCAITGENVLPVLEAAHIQPFASAGPHGVHNGLLLRSDFHKLFDTGLVTITPDHVIEVSPAIREEFHNGKAYYRLHGQKMAVVPNAPIDRPDPRLLAWHNQHVYRG